MVGPVNENSPVRKNDLIASRYAKAHPSTYEEHE